MYKKIIVPLIADSKITCTFVLDYWHNHGKMTNCIGKDTALSSGRKLLLVSDYVIMPPVRHWAFDTVSPFGDYIGHNPKQSLPLITCLNAPLCPLTDNGRLAEIKVEAAAKSVILSKLIGLLKD